MYLAVKTDSSRTLVWLTDSKDKISVPDLVWQSGRQLSEELLDRIKICLNDSNIDWHDLEGIVIYSGPGSFTSLRIGHTVMNALANSLEIPIVGASDNDWLEKGLKMLADGESDQIALPSYGAEAHITKPKT